MIYKPQAFIFDIDGTLAKMNGRRSPYEWDKVGEDTVNTPVEKVLRTIWGSGYKIIIFTGRDGCCADKTKDWLNKNDIHYDYFDIRPEGNNEKDSIIKERMFNKIKDKYNIVGVFDDRPSVLKMWKNKGVFTLDCNQDINLINF